MLSVMKKDIYGCLGGAKSSYHFSWLDAHKGSGQGLVNNDNNNNNTNNDNK